MEYKIDAANKVLGRLATEVAVLLRGKNQPDFDPAKFKSNRVLVFNTDKIRTTGKKAAQKLYRHHSGYHGGLKEERLDKLFERDSGLVLKRAVMGMLPKNKLRRKFIKNLILIKGEE